MTRFTVIWSEEALDQLAHIWLAAPDRPAINAATTLIDAELANDAEAKGSLLSEDLRALEVPPLHVLFAVSEPDRQVQVVLVRRSTPLAPLANGNGKIKS